MSGLMDYTYYLAKVIGPRPTGTEEEQQAALYITEQFQREAGFSANIEEFQRTTKPDLSYAILGSLIALISIASIFFSAFSIIAFVLIVILAAIYVFETLGHPLLSHMLAKGASQNVVAKYQPNPDANNTGRSITRKLIVVAHYDSGHVTPSLVKRLDSGKTSFNVIESGVMVLLAFLALIRIFVAITGGGLLIILNVITVLAVLAAFLPLLRFVLINNAPYNEGANNNASGSAALIEIARRISQGSVSENDLMELSDDVVVHGFDAAENAGLVPEGAVLSYEAQETGPLDMSEDDVNEKDRLLAAKAAIAALTGRPVENRLYATPQSSSQLGTQSVSGVDEIALQGEPVLDQAVMLSDLSQESEAEQSNKNMSAPQGEASKGGVGGVQDGNQNAFWDVAAGEEVDLGETNAIDMRTLGMISPEEVQPDEAQPSEVSQNENSISAYFAAAHAQANQNQASEQQFSTSVLDANTPASVESAQSISAAFAASAPRSAETVAAETSVAGFQNVPSWFAAAQKNAKRSGAPTEVQRSRFTEALENAERERIEHEEAQLAEEFARREAERVAREAEARAAIEAQERIAEEARAAAEEASRVAAEAEAAQAVAEQVSDQVQKEEPATRLDEQVSSADNDLVQEALNYKAAQEAESAASFAQTAMLPPEVSPEAINSATQAVVNRQERLMNLRTNIPSLSGVIRTKDAARRAAVESLSSTIDSTTISTQRTTAFKVSAVPEISLDAPLQETPVSRNLQAVSGGRVLNDIPSPLDSDQVTYESHDIDYDMVVSDFVSDYDAPYNTEFAGDYTGDFASNLFDENEYSDDFNTDAGGNYDYSEYDNAFLDDEDFDKPSKPQRKGFFSRFRRKKEEEVMESPQEWLGVNDNFDARSVGRARGGWESFRQDYDDIDDPFNDDGFDDFGDFDDGLGTRSRGGRWEGGSYSRMSLGHVDMRSGVDNEADTTIPDVPPEAEKDRFITGEIERIYHFRNPAFNTEIWFVAMGCDDDSHDGVRAFINEHKSELRGSMVIEIESIGAGVLSVAKREGATKKISASSRIKRYTREAVAATGIALDEVDLSGTDSIASIIQKAGFQSIHLFGAENGRPALKGSADDVFENIDELVFDENTRFVYELLKR